MTDEQQQADYPEAWRPEPGDTIAGTVVSVGLSPDFGYGPYPIVTLSVDGQERAFHAMHQIARTELARRRPSRGDALEITYLGTRKPKSGTGNPFHVYRVSGGKEREFDWDSELPEGEREAFSSAPPIAPAPVPAFEPAAAQTTAPKPEDDDIPF